jgi:hypothetical protein
MKSLSACKAMKEGVQAALDCGRANRDNNILSDPIGALLHAWFDGQGINGEFQRTQGNAHFGAMSWHCPLAGYGAFRPIAPGQPGTGDRYIEGGIKAFHESCALNFVNHDECLTGAGPLPYRTLRPSL